MATAFIKRHIEINYVQISAQEEEKRVKRIEDILRKTLDKKDIKSQVMNNQKEV